VQRPRKRLKFEDVPVSIFSMHAYCFIDQLQQDGKDRWKTQSSVRKG